MGESMPDIGIHGGQLVMLLLLLFVTIFAAVARKIQVPYPIVLVVAGLLLGFVPGIPPIALEPDLIFLVVLPPLLFASAWVTSWRDLSRNMVSIAMLAPGLVAFTVVAVAVAASWLLPGFDWRFGFVLGAAVSTTDAIAATSIAKRIGLPKNIVDLLEGESLINDATGLLALEFAIAMVVEGRQPTIGAGFVRLLYLITGGTAIGLIIGVVVEWFEHRIDDGPIEIAVSILVPYAAYLSAEAIHTSGVLAVVAAGLYLGKKSSEFFSPSVRLQARAVWSAIEFILNGFVFVLIGLQLPFVLAGVSELRMGRLLLYASLFCVFLIVFRLLWTFPGSYVAVFIRRKLLRQDERWPSARAVFVVGWTGMRGVLALAAAISLPETIADGSAFPHRDLIIFLTFSVILVTLVLQGLTLPSVIRALGLSAPSGKASNGGDGRRLVLEAALAHIEQDRQNDSSTAASVYDDLAKHYQRRLASVSPFHEQMEIDDPEHYPQYLDLSRALLDVERRTALRLRDEGAISDEALREIEHELDLSETRLAASSHA